jgi:hypothetical protein
MEWRKTTMNGVNDEYNWTLESVSNLSECKDWHAVFNKPVRVVGGCEYIRVPIAGEAFQVASQTHSGGFKAL